MFEEFILGMLKDDEIQIATWHYKPESKIVPNFYATKLSIKDKRDVLYPWEKEHDDVIDDDNNKSD